VGEHQYRYNHLSIPASPKPTPRSSHALLHNLSPQPALNSARSKVSRLALSNALNNAVLLPTPRSLQSTPRINATPRLHSSRLHPTNSSTPAGESTPRFSFRTGLLETANLGGGWHIGDDSWNDHF